MTSMSNHGQPSQTRVILHLDMDAFYASVEMLDNPALRGQPVIVGGRINRGVVCAASYEARKFGVHAALPMATARRLCSKGIFLPVRMARYQEVSARIFTIFHRFTSLVEPLSLDEAFLDVTGSLALFGSGPTIATTIRQLVRQEIGLTVSAGVATNKLVAKIASDLDKPDGLTVVAPGQERGFLAPLAIGRLWGVGRTTEKRLTLMGVRTIGDLERLSINMLKSTFGQTGSWLHRSAQGLDDRPVEPCREAKSLGNEETFATDLVDQARIRQELLALATKVGGRLRRHELMGRTITLKIKYHDFTTQTRSRTLASPTNDHGEIFTQTLELLKKTEAGRCPIRLLGVGLANLTPAAGGAQMHLFDDQGKTRKRAKVNAALDTIQDRFGGQAILPATLLKE